MTLTDYISNIHADRLAIITNNGGRLTYGELCQRVSQQAKELQRGVLQFCLCRNDIDSIVFYLACLQAQAPVVLLDANKDNETIENLRRIYKPGITHCHSDLALCLTTSGSTGSPKLVRLTQRNIINNALSIAEYLQIDENERPVTMLPMYYSYGLSIINSHLIKGATILLTDKTYAQREFWTFLREQQATSMSGVPYTWEMLRRLRFFRMELPSVKTMTQAGGKLNSEIAKEYIDNAAAMGKRFIVMYGQTEATARMSYLPWERAQEKYASIGIAIPGGEFSLADDGELIYIGENVSMGYAECAEDLMKGDENNGILYTGDMARVDEDGFYYITGRKKRFVKIWGNRCNLDAVEQIVKQITKDCAVVGVDDKITVFIVAKDSHPSQEKTESHPTQEELKKNILTLLSVKTGLNTKAFEVRQIDAIPVKETGKIDYQTLQQWI